MQMERMPFAVSSLHISVGWIDRFFICFAGDRQKIVVNNATSILKQ